MLAQPACTPQRTLNMESQQGLVRFYHVKVVICFMNALHNIRIRVLDGFEGVSVWDFGSRYEDAWFTLCILILKP